MSRIIILALLLTGCATYNERGELVEPGLTIYKDNNQNKQNARSRHL